MLKLKRSLAATAGAALVTLFAAATAQARKAVPTPTPIPPPQNVRVINTPAEPVPVTGTVSVSNLGTDPLPVRDVDNPASEPIQAEGSCNAVLFDCSADIYTVPAGKGLVIEYVWAEVLTNTGVSIRASIETTMGGTRIFHRLPLSAPAVGFHFSGALAIVSQQVRLYADPGANVSHRANACAPAGLCRRSRV